MNLSRRHVALVLLTLQVACTVKTDPVETSTINQFWKSETTITIESFQSQFNEDYWVHRYSVPDTSIIFEDWTAIDGTVSTYEYTVDLSAKTFTVDVYMNQELDATGDGVFEGDGWDWTSLEYGFTQSDGVSVVTVAQFSPDSMLYERVGYGMGGGAEWTMDEVLTPLDEATWSETIPSE